VWIKREAGLDVVPQERFRDQDNLEFFTARWCCKAEAFGGEQGGDALPRRTIDRLGARSGAVGKHGDGGPPEL
jgi:hypothetical protein